MSRKQWEQKLNQVWYQQASVPWYLIGLSYVYQFFRGLHLMFMKNKKVLPHLGIPVLVVGNITVGGTGKTPTVLALVKWLQQQGWSPAVISRGYGRLDPDKVVSVSSLSTASLVGDEPLLIWRNLQNVPVLVGSDRIALLQLIPKEYPQVNVVISDDGLQNVGLPKNISVVVVDGIRQFGNKRLLPAGPLREPLEKINDYHAVLWNGTPVSPEAFQIPSFEMHLLPVYWRALSGESQVELNFFVGLSCHVVAGIGHPERFFQQCFELGIVVIPHVFPDHYSYQPSDLDFSDNNYILMTEKDAIKCLSWANSLMYYLPIVADLDGAFLKLIETQLKNYDR